MKKGLANTDKILWTQIRSDQIIAAYDAAQVEKESEKLIYFIIINFSIIKQFCSIRFHNVVIQNALLKLKSGDWGWA